MGAGGGCGAFAVRMRGVAIPVVRKYILLVAKQVGKSVLEAIAHVLAERKRPSREMLTNNAQKIAIFIAAWSSKILQHHNKGLKNNQCADGASRRAVSRRTADLRAAGAQSSGIRAAGEQSGGSTDFSTK